MQFDFKIKYPMNALAENCQIGFYFYFNDIKKNHQHIFDRVCT